MKPSPEEILARLKLAAPQKAGFIVSPHAWQQMAKRNLQRLDLMNAFLTGQHAEKQENGRWLVKGLAEDGTELTVIVVIGSQIEVVTAYG